MTRPAVTLGYLRPSSKDELGNRRGGRDPRDQYGGAGREVRGESLSGRERGAAMYTPVSKAKLNALDPGTYLRHVIARIADASRQSRRRAVPGVGRVAVKLIGDVPAPYHDE